MSFDIAVVDGQLNLDFAGSAPKLNQLRIAAQSPRAPGSEPTVWVTGDSTVQSYTADYAPQAGWGQMLDRFLSDDVTVDNRAIGGRSSKNFISQGRLDEVLRADQARATTCSCSSATTTPPTGSTTGSPPRPTTRSTCGPSSTARRSAVRSR